MRGASIVLVSTHSACGVTTTSATPSGATYSTRLLPPPVYQAKFAGRRITTAPTPARSIRSLTRSRLAARSSVLLALMSAVSLHGRPPLRIPNDALVVPTESTVDDRASQKRGWQARGRSRCQSIGEHRGRRQARFWPSERDRN
jgi:hypothetical protein